MFNPRRIKSVLQNPYVLLFLITLSYYSFYFLNVFLNLNTLLSSSVDDSLKNYFTYVFQIKNSPSLLHFTGYNYPFGEHVVYTDCQPLLTFVLRLFPFTHNYSIGILHFLMFASILITPLIYLRLFIQLKFPLVASFAISLSITILSPQYFRIYCGHYALAYVCIIPLSMLFVMRYFLFQKKATLYTIFTFNSLLFLIHPYYGLGLSLFTCISFVCVSLFQKEKFLPALSKAFIAGILPVILFKLFMAISDRHTGRSPEPFGNTDFISEPSSFLVPSFGPFSQILTRWIGAFPRHFEGYSYLGLGFIVLLLAGLPLLIVFHKKIKYKNTLFGMFIACIFLLMFSFGIQYKLQEIFGFKIQALNQFRAMGRFSWFAYYVFPLFFFHGIYELLKNKFNRHAINAVNFLALFYLTLNVYEGDAYFKIYDGVMWEDRNVFNHNLLNSEETHLLDIIQKKKAQAVLPLPTFYIGSEMYERSNPTKPMFLSAIYAYHSGLPIVSACMSRTSLLETRSAINFLNSYKKNLVTDAFLSAEDVFVIKTDDPLFEDELRAWHVTNRYLQNDSTQFGFLSRNKLRQPILDGKLLTLESNKILPSDSLPLLYLSKENCTPFLPSNAMVYEMVHESDTNGIPSGTYILSFHYHTDDKTYISTANSMVVAKKRGEDYHWQDVIPLKQPSGFGDGYSIIERRIELDGRYAYEFFIHGGHDFSYHVSNFMLRPLGTSVRVVTSEKDTLYNNYPR
jgi:hypothetical protein